MGIKQLYNENLRKLPNEYGDVSVMRTIEGVRAEVSIGYRSTKVGGAKLLQSKTRWVVQNVLGKLVTLADIPGTKQKTCNARQRTKSAENAI